MATKLPVARRTDSLYAQLGGTAIVGSLVDKFYKKVLADPDLRPLFIKANMPAIKQRQVQFLTRALGGPVDSRNRETKPAHVHLLHDPEHFDRVATHLAVALSEMNIAPDIVDAVIERSTLEVDNTDADGDLDSESATEEAHQKEDLLGQIAAISSVQAVIEFEMDGTVITANGNFLNVMDYTLNEIKGKNHSLFVEESTRRSPEYKEFWSKLNRGEYQAGEFKRIDKNGKEVWLQASYHPILDSHGKPFKVVAYASDITKQHRLSEEVAELRVRADIANLTSIVSEADLKGDILSVNEKYTQVSKYSREELLGKPHNITRHPDMPKETFKELWSTIGRGKMFRGIIKNRAKDGTPYYVDAVIAPILGDDGKPKKYIGVRYDITVAETQRREMQGVIDAIDATYCYAEYDTAGSVLKANANFLKLLGYKSEDIVGKHQRSLVEPSYANSPSYAQFWTELNGGKTYNDVFKRITKDGREVWIQAVYAPVKDEMGRVYKLLEIGTDVTSQKLAASDSAGQIAAIGKAQAVIEFQMDGTVVNANENFLRAMGYTQDEIKGKHHSLFVDEAQRRSPEYKEFWAKLNRGEYEAGEFKRIGKGGKEVWLQASYNPILDLNGKPFKVVKYATEITAQKLTNVDFSGQIAAIGKAQAVIEFRMDGTVVNANENFLRAMGYTQDEIKDKHHSLFVDEAERHSSEYKEFWANLNRGLYQAGEFKRIGKGGREVWLQASYNPILDLNGKPFKVVKYASDITPQKAAADDLKRKVDSILVVVSAASKGDLTQEVTVSGTDAIGQMGTGLSQLFGNLRASIGKIGQTAGTLSTSSGELTSMSQQMSATAEETSAQAGVVSAASEEVSRNLQTVATSTEEMSATIKEIAKNTTESAKIASEAVKVAQATTNTVSKLGDSSTEIGQVIKVITSIAQQTNLLALNATIEAARAGEAGKGFAVVANEVKELAKETAKATEDISRKIEAIQTDTKGAVDAIGAISKIINQVNDISNTIATAVEEQDATTNEMTRNVTEAAKGANEIAKNIIGVAEAAKNTAQGAGDSQKSATQLSQMSAELRELVEQFKY